jgi:hypothetical protein
MTTYLPDNKKIKIKVEGHELNRSIELTLNWDADIEDWKEAFKTILTHQTFHPQTIEELFYQEQ